VLAVGVAVVVVGAVGAVAATCRRRGLGAGAGLDVVAPVVAPVVSPVADLVVIVDVALDALVATVGRTPSATAGTIGVTVPAWIRAIQAFSPVGVVAGGTGAWMGAALVGTSLEPGEDAEGPATDPRGPPCCRPRAAITAAVSASTQNASSGRTWFAVKELFFPRCGVVKETDSVAGLPRPLQG
jgi:hypothetical protein